ncbi:MAG: MFS transporter, partial [Candidatus Limnocylindria bacterium]
MSYRGLFEVGGFARLATSSLLVRTATSMWHVALVLFVLERFASPVLAGLAVFLAIAPGIVVSPLAGVLLDRHGRVRLMLLDYVLGAVGLALIAGLALADRLPPPALLGIVTAVSLTNPLGAAGGRSLFPLVVPRRLWDRANGVDGAGYTLAAVAGPPLAAILLEPDLGTVLVFGPALLAMLFVVGCNWK